MLDERRRLGIDGRDEMWDGDVHVVPPPGGAHQVLGARFFRLAVSRAEQRELDVLYETGVFRADQDYRVPDLVVFQPDQLSERGVERAEMVIEIRSPRDETYEKIGFYSAVGVQEVLILHPEDRRVELLRAVGGSLVSVQPKPDGSVESEVLGIELRTVEGKLRIGWPEGSADI
ncbi:Uma2 family endonuclease [Pseudonocardia sp. GCM10023141]